jgi:hypothetical protein
VAALAEATATQPRATTAAVWEALKEWKAECRGYPDDIAVLYVSGHGIQWGSRDDAIVLLEDFSNDEAFLNQAIDVGGTLKGMAGDDMPQVQFYFVDSCRIQPDEYSKYEGAGKPMRLRNDFIGEDLRAALIYYAACPQTAAKGRIGPGTYFAEALVHCLNGTALQGPDLRSTLSVARTHWHVSGSNLLTRLQESINEVARRDKEKQDVVQGGLIRPAVFSASPTPPTVTVVVDVDPDSAAQVAFAELWNWNRSMQIRQRMPCWRRPLKLDGVPVGIYLLELSASAPYKPHLPIAVNAQPPEWNEPITLS